MFAYTYRFFFFFNDTTTPEIYTLSLHDALPICDHRRGYPECGVFAFPFSSVASRPSRGSPGTPVRSEEHTSELQSQSNLVCRLLLEKKKKNKTQSYYLYQCVQRYTSTINMRILE